MLRTLLVRGTRARRPCILPSRKYSGQPSLEHQSNSRVVRPKEPPLLEQTIPQHFTSIVSQFGDRNAMISHHQNRILTYQNLDEDSDALARGLVKQGVRKGDRVAVFLGNNVEFATATYALFKLGAVLVPLNPAFNAPQVVAALTHLSATTLIIGTETNPPHKEPRSNIPLIQEIVPDLTSRKLQSASVPSLRNLVLVDNSDGRANISSFRSTIAYEDVARDGGQYGAVRRTEEEALDPEDIVNIQFTSGTTSMPKAACLTHRNILNNGKSIGDRLGLTEKDVVCCPPPLFHCFGSILGYMATATHGSAILFPSPSFHPSSVLQSIPLYRATALYGVPTMFSTLLSLASTNPTLYPPSSFSTLRTGIAAGSSIPAEMMKKLHRELGLVDLCICYGMTETSPVSAMTSPEDALEMRVNSVGRLLPHVEAKVVQPDDADLTPLPVGVRGELVVRGYLTMKSYWGDEQKTKEALVYDREDQAAAYSDNASEQKSVQGKQWMRTGDEASIDSAGYVSITGRIKDLIIRGGENIHPLEIENCLLAHPGVAECSVVGLPDEKYGEVVAAFIVPSTPHKTSSAPSSAAKPKHATESEAAETAESGTDSASEQTEERESAGLTRESVRAFVREHLSAHLVPKYVFWTDGWPKTPSGKIQKFKLREEGLRFVVEGDGVD